MSSNKSYHGVSVNVFGCGVLILGDAGIGKSELALQLIDRGHKFIADDLVMANLSNGIICVTATDLANDFIHVRGIGFINVTKIFGAFKTMVKSQLNLVVELTNRQDYFSGNVASQLVSTETILGIDIVKHLLPVGNWRPLPLLVEIIVKLYLQKQLHYDSHQEFIHKHNALLTHLE